MSELLLDDVKEHLRVTDTAEDALVQVYIDAVEEMISKRTGKYIGGDVRVKYFDAFADEMELKGPLVSITTVKYIDDDGSLITLASSVYTTRVKTNGKLYLIRDYDQSWPSVRYVPDAVEITYAAGYLEADIPPTLRAAIYMYVSMLYLNREPVSEVRMRAVPDSVNSLLSVETLFV